MNCIMGLDGVELIMEVEDHFGILLTEDEIASLATVGDMMELCQKRVLAIDPTCCMSLSSFLSLRRATQEIMNNPKLRIRPKTKIVDVFPRSQRRVLWKQLQSALEFPLPSLRRSQWLRNTLFSAVLISTIIFLRPAFRNFIFLPLSLLAVSVIAICLHYATVYFRSEPPLEFTTFGKISQQILETKIATKPPASTEPDAVFNELRLIIIDVLGVTEDDVVPSARFIEDLGVG